MRPEPTLYEVLQVDPRAEPEVVEAAYRRLARMYHPDVSNRAGAEQRMKAINSAYDVLSDRRQRAAYDGELAAAARAHAARVEPEVSVARDPEPPSDGEGWLGCRHHAGTVAIGACEECGAGLCVDCFERFQPPWCSACILAWTTQRRSRVSLAFVWFFGIGGLLALYVIRSFTETPPAPSWLVAFLACAGYLVASYPSGLAALGGGEAMAETSDPAFLLGFAAVIGPFVAPFRMIKLGLELRQLGRTEATARLDA